MTKKKNRGFSIVELLVVVGMLGGVSLVVMNISKLSTKSSVKLQLDTDITLTTSEINGILSNPAKCLTTFTGTTTPTNINGKYYISTVSPGNSGYGNSNFRISSYTLAGTSPDGILTIAFLNKNILKGSAGTSTVSKKINIYFEGPLNGITKCRALSTSVGDIWLRATPTSLDTYYSAGNIGIGTTTPTAMLDVAGGAKIASGLDVAGLVNATAGIKVGAVGADVDTVCTGAGITRYNATSDKMEYCNKLGKWATFGSSVPTCVTGSTLFTYTGANQIFTVPAGCTTVSVTAIGGGGGGGGANCCNGTGGGGGGGGGSTKTAQVVTVISGQQITVTIGAGGVGGLAGNADGSYFYSGNGGTGGTSMFGTYVTAIGGGGGGGHTGPPLGTETGAPGGTGGPGSGSGGKGGNDTTQTYLAVGGGGGGGGASANVGGVGGVSISYPNSITAGTTGQSGGGGGINGGSGSTSGGSLCGNGYCGTGGSGASGYGGGGGGGASGGGNAGGAGAPGAIYVQW